LTDRGGLGHGADGLAFVLQNTGPKAVAGRGSSGGWGFGDGRGGLIRSGMPRAVAIFFDTYQNHEDRDPSNNYVGVFTNGGPQDRRWPAPRLASTKRLKVFLKDGKVHTSRILFRPPVASVYLDDMNKPVLVTPIDLSLVADGEGRAWIGFTASTGGGYENHDVLRWAFNGTEVSSAMVSSNISFFMDRCLAGHSLCTPDRPIVEELGAGRYHVVLPANLEWGASIANEAGREVEIENARGTVCFDLQALGAEGCGGPDGSPKIKIQDRAAGALISKTSGGRSYFSVNDSHFSDNEGYFEFEVVIR
jgi:hypothetical protein